MYRFRASEAECFLVHPGGPYFTKRDLGAWGIPKGHFESAEPALHAALREFHEETGQRAETCAAQTRPVGKLDFVELGSVVQRGRKRVFGWAFEGDWPPGEELVSNTFPLEWPPRSGRIIEVPEVDRGAFFPIAIARRKINPAQEPFLDRLLSSLT